jgi:hypothetical protein
MSTQDQLVNAAIDTSFASIQEAMADGQIEPDEIVEIIPLCWAAARKVKGLSPAAKQKLVTRLATRTIKHGMVAIKADQTLIDAALAAIPPTIALTSAMRSGQLPTTTDITGCCVSFCSAFASRALANAANASAQRRTQARIARAVMAEEQQPAQATL